MKNYYAELGLDRSLSISDLEQQLKALKKRWVSRASSAATTEKRQQAERMVDLIREASETLLIKDKKAKYDRQLDKDPNASQQTAPTESAPAAPVDTDAVAGAAFIDLMEQFYDNDNYNQAIAVGKKAISTGNGSVQVYRLLALCYAERGDESNAFATLKQMISAFGSDPDAHFCFAALCLQVLASHTLDAKSSINWLVENGYEEDGRVIALDVEYDIDRGDKALADQKVKDYLEHNANDQEFRQSVCRAYGQYADTKLTEYGGDVYFDTEADMDEWLSVTEQALNIYPEPSMKKMYENNKSFKGKTFLSANWLGIACCALYTMGGFAASPFLGILLLALTGVMIYYSIVPKWQVLRFQYTNHLNGLYEVMRVINYVLSILIRWGWEITKFIFRLIFAFI